MTQDKSTQRATHSRWSRLRSQILPLLFALLMVASLPAMTLAGGLNSGTAEASSTGDQLSLNSPTQQLQIQSQTEDNASYYDDFGDGDNQGWELAGDPIVQDADVASEGFYGNHSLRMSDEYYDTSDYNRLIWQGGPEFNTHDNFEFSGTFKANGTGARHRIGLTDNANPGADGAAIIVSHDKDSTFLHENYDAGPPSDSEKYLQTDFNNQWANFRLQFDGGVARAKVWEAGTSEPETWQMEYEPEQFKGQFFLSSGYGPNDRNLLLGEVDAGGNAISGQVVDQNGEPVPNATVGALGADFGAVNQTIDDLNATAEEIEDKADEYINDAQNVELPDEWQEFSDEFGSDGMLDVDSFSSSSDVGTLYPQVHQEDDWGSGSTSILKNEVDDPRLQVDSDQQVVISLWDLQETGWGQGPVDGSHPGATTGGKVTLQQFGPGQGISSSEVLTTDDDAFTVKRALRSDRDIAAIKKHLSPGIYRVYPHHNKAAAITFQVGDAEEQWTAFSDDLNETADDLRDEAGDYVSHAEKIQQNVESGLFERTTTTTDENGTFTLRMGTGVQKATIQAYRADGTVLPDITGPSFQDLRDLSDGDYNGTFTLGAPLTHDVPKENVTLETYRTDQLPYQGIDSLNAFKDWVQEQQLNETIEDIQSETDEKIDQLEREYHLRDYQGSRKLVETVPGAESNYLDSSEFSEIQLAADLNKTQLQTESDLMQEALLTVDADPEDLIAIFETHASIISTMPGAREAYLEGSSFDEIPDASSLSETEIETEIELMQSTLSESSTFSSDRLEQLFNTKLTLLEATPGAQETYLESSSYDSVPDPSSLSDEELSAEIGLMQTALSGITEINPPDIGENPIDVSEGELNAEYPIPGGINTDTIQPEIHWSNGNSLEIPEEYWSVESSGIFATSNSLVIEGYPIGDTDPAAFDIRVMGSGSEGVLDDRLSALNPSFSGSVPDVRAIDVSTLSPGNSERVSMTMRTGDDSNYEGLENVVVYGPNGDQLDAPIDGDSASFEANGAGEHFVRATVTDTTGSEFVQTFSIRALEQGRTDPATVRAETATGDRVFALIGERLDDAEIRADGGSLEVDAIAPGGEIPSSVHVKPQAAMDTSATSIDVRMLEGSQEATVDSTVETVIHLDSLANDSVVWRGDPGLLGQPLADGGTRYGEVIQRGGEDSDKVIIRTYSEDDGSVSLTINEQPGWWDGSEHWLAQKIPRPSLPFLSVAMSAVSSLSIFGVGLFTRRRRRRLAR